MKLTVNELEKAYSVAQLKLVFSGEITGREFSLYKFMRGQAYLDLRTGKRALCMLGRKRLSEVAGVSESRIQPKLKALEKLGLIEPVYYIKVGSRMEGFESFDYVSKTFNKKMIKYIHYKINLIPGELEARKEILSNKKTKKKKLKKRVK